VSVEEFLESLDMRVFIAPAGEGDVRRIARLTQRTNQFNLTTRRYSETDIASFLADPACRMYVLRLLDRFGDNGTVGLAVVVSENSRWRIDTFLLSCRVIGRQVEHVLADRILRDAATEGGAAVEAEYVPTPKNGLVADFWRSVGFTMISESEDDRRAVWRFELSGFRPKTFPFLRIEES
jgi:FkbH-like protein